MNSNALMINNAAGLAPERSMVLPERRPEGDEQVILDALVELYAAEHPSEAKALGVFAPDVIYSTPRGDVFVGHQGLKKLLTRAREGAKVHHRLLQTPEMLPAQTMVIDQIVVAGTCTEDSENQASVSDNVRTLIVLKRRQDGLVSNMSEEEGHRRATAPLAARSASANNFYSPTDSMVSPCTSKLNLAKRKHHTKAKPMNLFANRMPQQQRQPMAMATDMDF
ncbi:unnamed protein product [Parajaminaea phylloscopi]